MVLIWPDKLLRLSLTPSNRDVGDRSFDASVIVGFLDENESSTVIMGVIISDSKSHKDLNEVVTSAIDLLAEHHPCCSRQSAGDCQECGECTTYQCLRVIAAFNEDSGALKNVDKHKEVIIYNPNEANDWNAQYNQFKRQNNKVGALQRNLLRMSKASAVFEELSSVLKDATISQPQQRIHNIPPITSAFKVPPSYSTEPKCNTIIEENPDWCGKQSLLFLHWNTSAPISNSGSFFEKRIPFVRALKSIWKERICSMSSTALTLDFVFGLLIGFCLIQYPATIQQQIARAMAHHDQFFNDNLQWLETFPAGFKLNVALAHRTGKEVRWILFYHERLSSAIAAASATLFGETISFEQIATHLLQSMGLFTAIFGSRFFFAMAFDMTRLALLHIHFLSEVFATCLRFEMSALKSFWLLFTGKKRNVLRQRSDHLHYDHMQLLLGMILFSTCLFLFTTVLVYHWFFAVTNFGAELFCGLLWFLHVSVEGGVQCERIILRRRRSRSNDTWKGNEVHFAPVSLPESISRLDTSSLMRLYDGGSESKEVRSTFLLSNVSTEYQESCVLKVAFRSESDFSIVSTALISSFSSVLSRLPTLLKRLFFGSHCNLAHSFIGFTNSLIKGK